MGAVAEASVEEGGVVAVTAKAVATLLVERALATLLVAAALAAQTAMLQPAADAANSL